MKKSDISPMPEYFDRYINLVADVELLQAFDKSLEQLDSLDKNLMAQLNGKKYALDKWTVNGVFQHLIDFERILSYRALIFARNIGITPQGIDENQLARKMNADQRTVVNLIEELKTVRTATKILFESFDQEALLNTGINWKYEMSVLAMGFNMIGHQIHHFNVIREKYYPLLDETMTSSESITEANLAQPKTLTSLVRTNQTEWQPLNEPGVSGIFVKPLLFDKETQRTPTILLKFEAGATYPAHNHPSGEEIFVIEGDLKLDKDHLYTGDYLYTAPNRKHAVRSVNGCIVLTKTPEEVEILKDLNF